MAKKRRAGRKTSITAIWRVNGQGPVRRLKTRHKGGTRKTSRDRIGIDSAKTAFSKWFGNSRKSVRWF